VATEMDAISTMSMV